MGYGERALRVLAADDSAVMRGVMRTLFQLHAGNAETTLPRMELCGLVKDGVEALEAVKQLSPDVLLLDFEMPRLGGLGVLKQLRSAAPALPVIMCSAYTERGARSTLDALAAGAKDYVMKPGQQRDFASALDTLMEQLLPKIAALAGEAQGVSVERLSRSSLGVEAAYMQPASTARVEAVVIAVSTGGPSALEAMLPKLPVDLGVPVLIVQHMPKLFTGALAERLDRLCGLPVQQGRDGALIKPGSIWLAPGDSHMEIAQGAAGTRIVRLHQGPMLNSCRPSADYLFRSAAQLLGAGTLALVMTGMGSDGFDGAQSVREAGGTILAQDEATSAVWGMPGRVARGGLAAATLPLSMLAGELTKRVKGDREPNRLRAGALQRQPEVSYGLL